MDGRPKVAKIGGSTMHRTPHVVLNVLPPAVLVVSAVSGPQSLPNLHELRKCKTFCETEARWPADARDPDKPVGPALARWVAV